MTLSLTTAAANSLRKVKKTPTLVLVFDGIDTVFSSASAYRIIRIGDTGLTIGNDWVIGGTVELDGQISAIQFSGDIGSTSTSIDYKLNPDLGFGDSITNFTVALVDNQSFEILDLFRQYEFIGRKCRVLLTPDPEDTNYPEDYIVIFRGIVDDLQFPPGGVAISISHPDQKKRQSIYTQAQTETAEAVDLSEVAIDLVDASDFLDDIVGPSGAEDTATFQKYIKIDDEIIAYTAISGNTLTGCTRGALNTTAATHDLGAAVSSFYRLQGNCVDLALKLMLSGWSGPFAEDVSVTNFEYINSSDTVDEAIFFQGVNVEDVYGLTVGDYVSCTGYGSASGNSFTLKPITAITIADDQSSYIEIGDVTLSAALSASAVVSFRSRYDTLPDGLAMSPDQVDVTEHTRLQELFLSTFDYDLYLKDTIDSGKEFIDNQIYKPIAAYSVPRNARSSLAFTAGPLPTQSVKTLDLSSVKNADKLTLRRSLGRNFYNTIIYKYDVDSLESKYLKGYLTADATSKATIPVGNRAMIIEAPGLRDANVAVSCATRRLNRYSYGAEYISNVRTTFAFGFNLEVGDLVIVDGESLKLPNFDTGARDAPARYFEIIKKKIDFQTGDVTLELLNTNYSTAGRYALISPASVVRSGSSQTVFDIQESYSSVYGSNEYLKWSRYDDLVVRVRNSSYNTSATAGISGFSGNTVTLSAGLGFTPSAGMIMELAGYSQATDQIKLLYGFVSSGSGAFSDGGNAYYMI